MTDDKPATGRPSAWKDEYIEQAKKLCELGATDIEIADFFKIDISTFYRWKASKPAFCEAIKLSKEIADERVKRSLYAKAVGYERDETDIKVVEGQIVETTVRKHYPPDSTAMIFWLKNRCKDEFRDKVETEVSGTLNINRAEELSDDELAVIATQHDSK